MKTAEELRRENLERLIEQFGSLRAPLYSGGPRELDHTGYTVSVNCLSKALELRDRQGVVFARNYAATQLGKDLAEFLCAADPPKRKN